MTKFESIGYGDEDWHYYRYRIELMVRRNCKTKIISFVRFGIRKFTIGAFLKHCNYAKGEGVEIFTRNHHLALVKSSWKHPIINYSGSIAEPWTSVTFRFGRLWFGGRSPKWLVQRKENQRDEEERKFFGYDDELLNMVKLCESCYSLAQDGDCVSLLNCKNCEERKKIENRMQLVPLVIQGE